ncbi:MAG: YbaB/EbfC family nucleoid-associated protein [Thermoanaerobaculia bacterium]
MKIQKLMKQAQEMQARLEQNLATLVIEASAGGGMVSVKMNGKKQLLSVVIDPEVLAPEESDMVADLVVAAVNDASRQVDEAVRSSMGDLGAGLGGLF